MGIRGLYGDELAGYLDLVSGWRNDVDGIDLVGGPLRRMVRGCHVLLRELSPILMDDLSILNNVGILRLSNTSLHFFGDDLYLFPICLLVYSIAIF